MKKLHYLQVSTYDPTKYVLINEEDGTRWRGDPTGHWVRDEGPKVPRTPEDIRNFLGSSFSAAQFKNPSPDGTMSGHEPHEEDTYTVTAHDLLEAFAFWSDR